MFALKPYIFINFFRRQNKFYALKYSSDSHTSEVFFYFKENDIFTFIRKRQFTTIDFISSCGGILGLFAGISILSIVELFYYFSIRIAVNAWTEWKECKVIMIKNETILEEEPNTDHKKESVLRTIKNYIIFVLQESSIHGCIYIVDPLKNWFER